MEPSTQSTLSVPGAPEAEPGKQNSGSGFGPGADDPAFTHPPSGLRNHPAPVHIPDPDVNRLAYPPPSSHTLVP